MTVYIFIHSNGAILVKDPEQIVAILINLSVLFFFQKKDQMMSLSSIPGPDWSESYQSIKYVVNGLCD